MSIHANADARIDEVNVTQLATFTGFKDDKLIELKSGIDSVIQKYEVNTVRRLRYFMAQTYFETIGFTHWEENLYYTTPERLVAVWPSRFTMNKGGPKLYAPDFVKNAEKLADVVYAERYGNGAAGSGDAFKFRGRGAMHLTFFNNYNAASMDIYGDARLVDSPELVARVDVGMITAGWFWEKNSLNACADQDAFTITTKRINGSTATVKDRLPVLRKANNTFDLT